MSEQIYTIKESTLRQMARLIKDDEQYWENKNITIDNILFELETINCFKECGYCLLTGIYNKESQKKTLYIPRYVTRLTDFSERVVSIFSSPKFEEVVWLEPLGTISELSLRKAFKGFKIKTLTIPDFGKITDDDYYDLGQEIASNCIALTTVNWESNLHIPRMAFYGDSKLETFNLNINKDFIIHVGQGAFYGCEKISNFDFSQVGRIEPEAFYGCKNIKNLIIDNKTHFSAGSGKGAFEDSGLTTITFNKKTIPQGNTFKGTKDLTTLTINFEEDFPLQVSSLFENSGLTAISGIDKITEIGGYTFAGACLKDVKNFENVTYLGNYGLAGLTGCTELEFPSLRYGMYIKESPLAAARPGIDENSSLISLVISPSQSGFLSSFIKNSNINTIKFRGTIEEWCSRSFLINSDWPFMKTKTSEAGEIVYDQLYVLNSSGELVEPKGSLGSNATADIPYVLDIETINSNVFYGYKNFGSFQFSNNLKSIKADAFKNSQLNTSTDRIRFDIYPYEYLQIDFENEYSTIYASTVLGTAAEASRICFKNPNGTNYSNLNSISDTASLFIPLDSGKQYANPIIFSKNAFANIPFANLYLGQTASYPNKDLIVEFKDKAFYQSSEKLKDSEGETIKRGINTCNFYYTKNIIIGNQSFYNNNRIVAIQTYGTTALGYQDCNISSIGEEAFYGCTSLKSTQYAASNTFILPIVKTIGDRAFQGCVGLSSVTLGSTSNPVESVGEEAFVGCTGIIEFTLYTNDQNIIAANTIPDSWGIDLEKEDLSITIVNTTSQEE